MLHTGVSLNLLKLCWLVEWCMVSHARAFLFTPWSKGSTACSVRQFFSSKIIMPLLHERRGRYLRLIGRAKSKPTRDVNCSHTNHNINIHSRAINSVKEK